MITTIIIYVTIVILAIIGLMAYFLYLRKLENERLDNLDFEKPKDDKIYLDRLRLLRRRYEQVACTYDLEDDTIPEEIRSLLVLVDVITNRI